MSFDSSNVFKYIIQTSGDDDDGRFHVVKRCMNPEIEDKFIAVGTGLEELISMCRAANRSFQKAALDISPTADVADIIDFYYYGSVTVRQ